ncbi:glycosyltransferase [Halochromatium glycolicum]|uniref:Glycosyltransferase n=1 Tax=Halochromatium glycolicum TaxID=85075 RepID=A0AAJ0X9X5_9GAMM|nr:hypothetical protein [Halochromatium glycolicum]
MVLNPRRQFKDDRFRYIERSRAQVLFTQLDLGIRHPHVVRFRLGRRGGTDFSDPNVLHYTRNSPYLAFCLAIHMGAKRIGLIGVDFTDHHFFGRTGPHPLGSQLATIDQEFGGLVTACADLGVEVYNLGEHSRLTSIPKLSLAEFSADRVAVGPGSEGQTSKAPRLFIVHYQFLSCGDVITQGLADAARALDIEHRTASCDDPRLPVLVERFAPDLLLVIHGRTFRQRWGRRFAGYRSAVWLVDEPYEVDDTVRTSLLFDSVFLNDPSTLSRHENAHYLPLAYNPRVHQPESGPKHYEVGFIGGYNARRERFLSALAEKGLLSYVVGGPWKSAVLRGLCLSGNVPPAETRRLYQRTRIVVNLFREQHHYNRERIAPHSLNPRVYEALACGALVVSEERPELLERFPELPRFTDPQQLVSVTAALLRDRERCEELLKKSTERLAGHGYPDRLSTLLAAAVPRLASQPLQSIESRRSNEVTHRYDILMVVHNGLAMVQLSVLRTLRSIDAARARLCVVDNASDDGTEVWLESMARRGDIHLIREPANIGHGPGLERARRATGAPMILTLDSDAFPLCDDWLARLDALLKDKVKVAGIGHHRGYIHPSCLMIARDTLDALGLTFLNEKDRPSRFDVAERISAEVKRRGFEIEALPRTGAQCRGSRSEPVYLGSTYADIVYHQWYSTRAILAAGKDVDDVPRAALERSLQGLLDTHQDEPREITVIVGVRVHPREPERLRNALACLRALSQQRIARWRYRIVVVEQDACPRCRVELGPYADTWIFAFNPGPYNRGWGFNLGACRPAARSGLLCLIDADLLVPHDFLAQALVALSPGTRAVQPYDEIRYLAPEATLSAIQASSGPDGHETRADRLDGRSFRNSSGGCLFVDARLYREIGGHNEAFRGWGREDREFYDRLAAKTRIAQLSQTLLHLHHPPAAMDDASARANRALYERLRHGSHMAGMSIGRIDRYAAEAVLPGGEASRSPGYRDWERWYLWPPSRLDRIISNEQRRPQAASDRALLADLALGYGEEILDLGCGAGSLQLRLAQQHPGAYCVGVDVTDEMLRAVRRHIADAPLCRADGERLPFADASFDVVVMRHILEHLPVATMPGVLREAMRAARQAVLIAFYVTPSDDLPRDTRIVGEGFLETRWNARDLLKPIESQSWHLARRDVGEDLVGESAAIWELTPQGAAPRPSLRQGRASDGDHALRVSIIMPTYRRSHRLMRVVEMVLAQSHTDWELIVVDNFGDAGDLPKDERIRLYRHAEKASSSHARNAGLRYARGELLCFFDDDDDMYPDYLARFVEVFRQRPRVKLVRCGMLVSNDRVNFSYATPECCIRRRYATPTWDNKGPAQDQRYFRAIVRRHRWSERRGDIAVIRKALCRANTDAVGGLRQGGY